MTPKAKRTTQEVLIKKKYQKPKDIKPEHQAFILKVGKKLQTIREEKNLSPYRLSQESGIPRSLYYLLEDGKVYFTISSLLQVLDYYNISATDFFKKL